MKPYRKVIAIGASAGGVSALKKIFSLLSSEMKAPIVIIQHLPADANIDFNLVFGHDTDRKICEARDKMDLVENTIYIAPPGYHLLIEKEGYFSFTQEEKVHYSRPSIDVFFQSLALAYKSECCGILLTGANADGAQGLKDIFDFGGFTMVQDPELAEVKMMPSSALKIFHPDFVGDIKPIANMINLNMKEQEVES